MKSKSKIIFSLLLVSALICGGSNVSAASNDIIANDSMTSDVIILRTQYFVPKDVQNNDSRILPRYVAYPEGTVKITDVLSDTSGKYKADEQSAILSTLLGKTFDLIKNVPGVGTVYTTGREILDWTMAVNGDMSNLDYTKSSTFITYYSFRNFTHKIDAYTNLGTWKDVGYSISRYFYKHSYSLVYDKSKGDFVGYKADYSYTEGCSPRFIAKAPNYMNYSNLERYGSNCYWTGNYYRENYY